MSPARARRLFPLVATVTAAALGLAACGSDDGGGNGGEASAGGKLQVVASTNVWGSVVSAVGGDKVEVKSIIDDPSSDPHSYEASAEDAADVRSADVLVYNGGGYDDFFEQMAEGASAKPVVAFDISGKAEGEGGHEEASGHEEGEGGHEEEGGHAHGEVNEHVWYDLPTVGKVADAVAKRLAEADPSDKKTFTSNAADFKSKLDDLTKRVEKIGQNQPGNKVVATEPVAHYLLEAAGVTDATPHDFAEAIENETDVPVAAQQEITELITGKKVQAVINNEQTVTPVTERIVGEARNAGIPVVGVTETLPEGTTGYIAWMTSQVDALSGALSK